MEQHSPLNNHEDLNSNNLEEAFENFSEATNYLTEFYKGLEQEVAKLNAELTSARKEKNHQHNEKEKLATRLSNILHVLPAGIIVLDANGVINQVNPVAIELLDEPLIGEFWRDVVERSFEPRWDDGHDVRLKDGRYVNLSTQSLDAEPGQIILLKDVSDNRLLQEQYSDLKRLSAMGEMAASLAHQVRTPLSSAILYASNISRNGLDETVRKKFSDKLLSRLQNLETLVEDMLLFARGGRFDAKPQTLASFIDDLDESLQVKIEEYQCSLSINKKLPDIKLNINQPALISCIHNLVTNAVQSIDTVVKIEIDCVVAAKDKIQLSIKDNGSGIPKNIQDKLFEPFFTTRSQGTGLGLPVVEAVVRAHNGKLRFESKESEGTVFYIQLPIHQNELETKTEKQREIADETVS